MKKIPLLNTEEITVPSFKSIGEEINVCRNTINELVDAVNILTESQKTVEDRQNEALSEASKPPQEETIRQDVVCPHGNSYFLSSSVCGCKKHQEEDEISDGGTGTAGSTGREDTIALLDKAIEELEGEKKTGKHEFEVGFSKCKWCDSDRKGAYQTRNNIVIDRTTGGSSAEVTMTEWDITGQYCEKNTSSDFNQGLSTAISHLTNLRDKLLEK
jgi:hypothetical protein